MTFDEWWEQNKRDDYIHPKIAKAAESNARVIWGCSREYAAEEIAHVVNTLKRMVEEQEDKIHTMAAALIEFAEWSEAYPVEVFPEPTPEQVDAVCKTLGFRLDSISAMILRHASARMGKIAREALGGDNG